MKTGIKVADAMSVVPVSLLPNKTIYECAKIMSKRKVGSLLIIKGDTLEGIITEKDLVHFIAKGFDAKAEKVCEVMTKKIHTISPEEDLYEALHRMKKEKVRRLPVMHNKKLVGMLTLNDILKLQPALFDIIQERSHVRLQKDKEKSVEGNCEICENFAALHDIDGKFICSECREEMSDDDE